jgi:hypothetical protein
VQSQTWPFASGGFDDVDFLKSQNEEEGMPVWEELDVELALEKIKKASELITASKQRLVKIENEFKEIKKEVDAD